MNNFFVGQVVKTAVNCKSLRQQWPKPASLLKEKVIFLKNHLKYTPDINLHRCHLIFKGLIVSLKKYLWTRDKIMYKENEVI